MHVRLREYSTIGRREVIEGGGGGVWGYSHMYMYWWAGERLARETSYLHSRAQPGGGAAVFLHCAYTTSDDAFVHSIVVNSPRQCRSGTATNQAQLRTVCSIHV